MSTTSYSQEILRVLFEAGEEGITVQKIALHVYNASNTLFNPVEYSDIHKRVVSWLRANSHGSQAMVVRLEQRGRYAINSSSEAMWQLSMQFSEFNQETPIDVECTGTDKRQLSLF